MIVITGGTGLLGKSLQKFLPDAIYLSSKDLNLINQDEVIDFFNTHNITYIIHLAALVGGIIDNSTRQYDYFYNNVQINTNLIHECVKRNIKLLTLSSTCVYPMNAPSYPMNETMIHLGMPEITNLSYGYAKRMMDIQLEAANKQYGLNYITLYSSNLYGPNDHFDNQRSHLVAALIQKFHYAKINNLSVVELWGTGKSLRQFTYVDDISQIITKLVNTNHIGQFNVATPENLSIKEIVQIVKNVIGYEGNIIYNNKLDGQYRKDVECSKLEQLIGPIVYTALQDGVMETYKWYLKHGN